MIYHDVSKYQDLTIIIQSYSAADQIVFIKIDHNESNQSGSIDIQVKRNPAVADRFRGVNIASFEKRVEEAFEKCLEIEC